jgi:TolB-like protein/DNA-binding winged helix-turn-helix (wHTH) protein
MSSQPSAVKSELINFGVFCVDLRKGELRKFDRPIKLQPQPFRLLLLLLNRSGELVTREEIRQEIWGKDTYVDFERGLNHCVRQIRAALGDDANTSRYIETVPRSGYRFIAPITRSAVRASGQIQVMPTRDSLAPVTSETVQPRITRWWRTRYLIGALLVLLLGAAATTLVIVQRQPRGVSSTPIPSRMMIAVLPFENLTGDSQQEYLSDGITDEMILHLSKLSPQRLGVIARTSSMKYKDQKKGVDQISRELGVTYLLEGSVKRVGPKIRVTAELIQAKDQTHVWADSYDGEVSGERFWPFSSASQTASRARCRLCFRPHSRTGALRIQQPTMLI